MNQVKVSYSRAAFYPGSRAETLYKLLPDEPFLAKEVVALFAERFPKDNPTYLRAWVANRLRDFSRRGLLKVVGERACDRCPTLRLNVYQKVTHETATE